jgi:hypothetical protein
MSSSYIPNLVGSTVSGSYTAGSYDSGGSRFAIYRPDQYSYGGRTYDAGSGAVELTNGVVYDYYTLQMYSGDYLLTMYLGGNASLLSSVAATEVPNVAAITSNSFALRYPAPTRTGWNHVNGRVRSLSAVPVPAALPLMVSAFGALAFAAANRKRSTREA